MEVEMFRKMLFPLFILSGILFLASCNPRQASPTKPTNTPNPPTIEPTASPTQTSPASTTSPAPTATAPAPTASAELASDGWKVYRNGEFGYSFHYPADATIVMNDDPVGGMTIVLPQNGPQFYISHPSDREEYRPPEGVDLAKWLSDHYLSGEKRLPDTHIAGTKAIHFRHDRSPQSYADDRYFFAKDGQLYLIIIGHAEDKEDWEVYNQFLDSFRFDQ
jgi:hypothetical protein